MKKQNVIVIVTFLVGFFVGALAFRFPEVKAQYGGPVTVQQVPLLGLRSTLSVGSSQVIGFACVQNGDEPECYVASR